MGRTLAEKVWDEHVVRSKDNEPDLLYIDLHLVHEVTSPQAFEGLRLAGRGVRRTDLTLATEDHNTPTDYTLPLVGTESISRRRSAAPRSRRCGQELPPSSGCGCYPMGDAEQGIVHVIGPQLGHHPARHDDRVRRLAHLHARCVRCPRVRHRYQPRSNTCWPPRRCRSGPT